MTPIARDDTSILGRWWWTVDRWTLLCLFMLTAFGMMLTAAASPPVAERIGLDSLYFVRRHAILIVPAIALLISISLLEVRSVRRLATVAFIGGIGLLAATLVIGPEIKGSQRWLTLGGLSLQPSEFIKPAFAVVAAWMFSARRLGEDIPGYQISGALYLLVMGLLLAQPDVGQAIVVSAIWFTQWFLAGLSATWVGLLIVLGLTAMIGAYFTFPHVASRIDRFLDPASGDSYQVDRAMEAFMNGGLFGRGPGEGTAKAYLPDAHSDFILAVAGEEFGLLACLILVVLFAFIVLRGLTRVLEDKNLFIVLAAAGLLVQFALQAIINMASTVNLMPTKGMTLPFISYGGSSLLALAFGMGMLLALTRRRAGGAE
ncbi:MAG: cell division protein FtsW [Alphaproteobacteria bacterium]|nr:cell division protein FtsW [Alphaproteobacteria bacterium]